MAIKIEEVKPKKLRGFAAMSVEKRKAAAARGGANVKLQDRAFYKNAELAARAGSLGGKKSRKGKKNVSTSNAVDN